MSEKEKVSNGLSLLQIKSLPTPLEYDGKLGLEDFISQRISDKSFVVAYFDNEVLIGIYENKKFYFCQNKTIEPKFIQRLRVFNKSRELLLWRTSDGLKGRLRDDTSGKDTDVVDAQQVLFGTKIDGNISLNCFTKITEDRGTTLILPFALSNVDEKKNRVFIKTRNYIAYNNYTYQATYVDCRFLGFYLWNDKASKMEELCNV